MRQYIDFNTQKRAGAKNAFEKDFFKLMNNSVYGKTCENLRKRVDVRLVTDKSKLSKLASKPTYVNSKIFTEDLVAVHKIKETLKFDRPASECSLRGRRLKGKGKGVLGARETRGAREEGGRETPARRPLFFSFLTSTRRM